MNLSLIVAVASNNVIGKDNQLIWRLPKDMKFFKETTMGHHIITGRKNYESIGFPLPGRKTIIITRQKDYVAEGCIVVNSIEEAIKAVENDDEPFIIGGAEIYKLSLPYVKTMYITKIDASFEGDTFFPEIDYNEWNETSCEKYLADEKHAYDFSIIKYEKK